MIDIYEYRNTLAWDMWEREADKPIVIDDKFICPHCHSELDPYVDPDSMTFCEVCGAAIDFR